MKAIVGVMVLVVGCHSIGDRCTSNDDCDGFCSALGSSSGFCTRYCDTDADCDEHSRCVRIQHGSISVYDRFCRIQCGDDADCAYLGSGYSCVGNPSICSAY